MCLSSDEIEDFKSLLFISIPGLVLWAYQSEKYAQHQAQQAQQAQVGGTLGDEFFLSVEIFNSIIWDFLLEIEEQMNRLS